MTKKSIFLIALFLFMTYLAYKDESSEEEKHLWFPKAPSLECVLYPQNLPLSHMSFDPELIRGFLEDLRRYQYEKIISQDPLSWPQYGLDKTKPKMRCFDKEIFLGSFSNDGMKIYFGFTDGTVYLGPKHLSWIFSRTLEKE